MFVLLGVLQGLLFTAVLAQRSSTEGFISIDCGSGRNYTDSSDGLMYVADELYTSAGVNRRVSFDTNLTGIMAYYANVRSFPDGARNCYTLRPVKAGSKYRVTGEFRYGNYDGLGRPPSFDLYLGVNLWTTVEPREYNREEIVFVAGGESVQVCLVNTGSGTPFISELDLRPLPNFLYSSLVKYSQAILVREARLNFGATDQIRYPQDAYDRRWFPSNVYARISSSGNVEQKTNNEYMAPPAALQTAVTSSSVNESLKIDAYGNSSDATFVIMYFSELQQLRANQSREFDIYAGDNRVYGPVRPTYLEENVVYTDSPGFPGGLTFSLRPTLKSTLPPLINAMEILVLQQLPLLPTSEAEVEAMVGLKKLYGVSENWEGDPCTPQKFSWQGVGCSLSSSEKYATITTLNLSKSGLSGPMPLFLANLTYLTSLDMSYNNITGEIPSSVWQLPALKFLNLESNNLTGDIPPAILGRSQIGLLELRLKNNPVLCSKSSLCDTTPDTTKKNNKNIIVPVAVAISVSVLLLLVVVTFCTLKIKKAKKKHQDIDANLHTMVQRGDQNSALVKQADIIHTESHIFSPPEILRITNNFQQPIGKGGFGTVYHGRLDNGIQVAVKIVSQLSDQGEKQFRAEAQLLTRVHHKHLVSLFGYCKENLALVYEFVSLGSLSDHLLGESQYSNFLNWGLRLQIALESAQGLDYLHYGCKPPIIHRDVKASNILLNENFEAKLADFGLSRSYTHIDGRAGLSTVVAGTPGYLDPECFQTNRMTEKSDVYSFGVVLLELITGKPAISFNGNRTHISQEVKMKLERGDLHSIVDRRIQGQYDVNSAWKFIEIALACTSYNSEERPIISDVVTQLKECQSLETLSKSLGSAGTDSISTPSPHFFPTMSPSSR
ncbi:putative LRR receptor-like serine/threonine-protein kinase At1g05700 [Wolffia australiana]